MIEFRRKIASRNTLIASALTIGLGAGSVLAAPSPNAAKRGYGGNDINASNSLNVNWHYNWGRTTNATQRGEFVPMAWGANSVALRPNFEELLGHDSEYILGFNEPERPDQANMSVATAISLWPQLMSTGKKLVSPAVSDNAAGRAWLTSFMSEINRLNYRVDAIAFHWYGDVRPAGAGNSFLNQVDWYRNSFMDNNNAKYPIWITEFGGVDFTGGANPVTPEMNEAFLQIALPGLDSRPYVERYAWWNWNDATTLGSGSPFTPSIAGDLYNGRTYKEGQTVTLDGLEGDDTFYLRGGTIDNASTTKSIRFLDALDGFSEVQGSANWEVADGSVRIRTGATLRKYGTNNVKFGGIPVYNDGQLFAKAGPLELGDGTVVTGTGLIKTETGSSILLTGNSAATGTDITNNLQLAAGTLNVVSGKHTLNGSIILSNSGSGFIINGTFTLNGGMTGAGNLTKTGTGTFRAAGASTNTGIITISNGTLEVANDTGSATGTGALVIGTNATLSGDGIIGASITTINGTLSPSATGPLTRPITFTQPLTLGTTSTTRLDVGSASTDFVVSASSITLAGSLVLQATLQPSDLVPLDVMTANQVNGIFRQVAGHLLPTSPQRALAVTYSGTKVTATQTLTGDLSLDGAVNFSDLLVLAQNYLQSDRSWSTGDISGDGVSGFDDLLLMAQNYGVSLSSTAPSTNDFASDWILAQWLVPEPAALFGVFLLMPGLRRHRTAR